MGIDGIVGEAWMYSNGKMREKLKEVIRRVWRGEGSLEEWRKVITPIHKKVNPNKVKNYREVTLLYTAYKLYAGMLTERLRQEAEERDLLPET